ncbi:MAG: bifunctional oligoribonuclease/PAP phosphatase NrnA, partial [Lachnospiraceae bacterium]|nr:bifunctional oligoribonuclease/PAP phosphatase NrnA [Lachnospiraceae bacterium]
DGKVIASCIREEDFRMFGSSKDDTDGIIDKLRVTEGIEVAILGYQTGENSFKFSLRSVSNVDVSVIAVELGGGGHIRASGVSIEGSYEESLERILKMIEKQL